MSTVVRDIVGQEIQKGDWVIVPHGSWNGVKIVQVSDFTPKYLKIYGHRNKPTYFNSTHCYRLPPEHVTIYLLKKG